MPTVTGPDGRKLKFPEGTPQEEVMAVLAQQYPDSFSGQAAVPAPGGPAAPPGGPAAPSPGAGTGDPTGATPSAPPGAGTGDENPLNGMPWYQRAAAGAGQSVDSSIRSVRQLYNYLVGDDAKLAELKKEEEERRALDAPLLGDLAGRSGQIAGYIAQMAVPGGQAAKATKLATAGMSRGAQMAAMLGTESALGAGAGAMNPIVEGESVGRNALTGAATAGLARLAPGAVRGATAMVGRGSGISPAAEAIAKVLRSGKDSAAKQSVRSSAGQRMGEIMGSVNVPLKPMASELSSINKAYGSSLPDPVRQQLDDLANLGKRYGAALKGDKVKEMRTAIYREASDSTGLSQSGLERIGRALDKGIDSQLTKAQAKALRQARTEYKTGQKQPGMGKSVIPVTAWGNSFLMEPGSEQQEN